LREAEFIAGDWGTSRLRLWLCARDGAPLDSRTGPGAASTGGRFAETLALLTAEWQGRHGALPAVLCGMVGSNIGWVNAPYVACPSMPQQIIEACVVPVDGRVRIVPGLSCRNRFGAPDFLRGEETQILGALHLAPVLRQGHALLCLPGTHTKWAAMRDGLVEEFLTAPAGEVFALLCAHSVLVRKSADAGTEFDHTAFAQAVAASNDYPDGELLHRLFECRSRQLQGELAPHSAAAYLSGLLIASDVRGALRCLADADADAGPGAARSVCLIGDAQLTQLYARALAARGVESHEIDGAEAVLAGLSQIHGRLFDSRGMAAHGT